MIFSKEYEDYLITGNETAINSLPNGSIKKDYFLLIQKLLKEEYNSELESKIKKFIEKNQYSMSNSTIIRLKSLLIFKKISKYPEKKSEIIKDIKKLFNLGSVTSYEKPVKYYKVNKNESENEEKKTLSKLNLDDYIFIYKFIEDVYSGKTILSEKEMEKILGSNKSDYYFDYNKIPISTLVQLFCEEGKMPKNCCFKPILFMNIDYLKTFIKACNEECSKDDKKKEYFRGIIESRSDDFSEEQINAFLEYNDIYNFESLIITLFKRKEKNIDYKDTKKSVSQLKEILNFLKKYNKTQALIKWVLLHILELNIKINIYEFDIFLEYIKLPLNTDNDFYNINEKLEEKINTNMDLLERKKIWEENYNIIRDEKKLIEKYLKHFYLREKYEFNKFNKYFNENYIKKFYAKMKLYSASEEPLKDGILSTSEINNLMNQICLNFLPHNKENFKINEDIELYLEIKNIENLYINIYEINTENYYYTNLKEFDTNISLEGYIPTYEDKLKFDEKPQLLHEQKIIIDKIPKKRGLYVIELIGNGHVSRAVIQKGWLRCIHKNTSNGKVVYILDQDNEILKGEKTGIWINKVWYPSIKDTGAILIPYSTKNGIFILKHDDFCCLENDINIPNEIYKLDGNFIINEESFIMGNVTKILFRPYLYICDEICPLDILTNVKIQIDSITTENNQKIPMMNVIDNVKLSYDKEYAFEFQVPPKLKKVTFTLSGDVKYKSKSDVAHLTFDQSYEFTKNYDYDTLIKKDDEGNYLFYFLGKNGEPKINHHATLELNHKFQKKINDDMPIFLETDLEGKINLGKLKDIKNIYLNNIYYNFNQIELHSTLPNIILLDNEEINIPFKSIGQDNIYLTNDTEKKDANNHIKNIIITDNKNNLGTISLSKLPKGNYNLSINNEIYTIEVRKGKKMNIKNFVIDEDENIFYHNYNETPIAIENVSYQNKELKIKLNENSKSNKHPRIHIDCVQYWSKDYNINVGNFIMNSYYEKIIQETEFEYKKYENSYYI